MHIHVWALPFLLCIFQSVTPAARGEKILIVRDTEGDHEVKLLVLIWSDESSNQEENGCEVFSDKKLIDEILTVAPETNTEVVTEDEVYDVLQGCTEVTMRKKRQSPQYESLVDTSRQNSKENEINAEPEEENAPEDEENFADNTTEVYDGWKVIFPGTKWCGAGDIADNYDDLGRHSDSDKCCRAHDLCNDTLAPGSSRNGLKNTSPFTKLSCQCDNDFYDCLDTVNSIISNKIGIMYFNLLRRDCYELDYPLTKKCKTFRSFIKLTCKEYERNTKAPKVYQWKSAKSYKKFLPWIKSPSLDKTLLRYNFNH